MPGEVDRLNRMITNLYTAVFERGGATKKNRPIRLISNQYDRIGLQDALQDLTYSVHDPAVYYDDLTPFGTYDPDVGFEDDADVRFEYPSSILLDERRYRREVLRDGPTAWWRLNDDGDDVVDHTGNGHTGTRAGATTGGASMLAHSDPDAASMDFDSFDSITISDFSDFWSSYVTVECIISPDTISSHEAIWHLASAQNGGGGYTLEFSSTSIRFRVYTSTDVENASVGPLSTGETYYVCGRFDGENVSIYVQDLTTGTVLSDSVALVGDIPRIPALSFPECMIGMSYDGVSINGSLAEVAVYPYALSDERVAVHGESARTRDIEQFWVAARIEPRSASGAYPIDFPTWFEWSADDGSARIVARYDDTSGEWAVGRDADDVLGIQELVAATHAEDESLTVFAQFKRDEIGTAVNDGALVFGANTDYPSTLADHPFIIGGSNPDWDSSDQGMYAKVKWYMLGTGLLTDSIIDTLHALDDTVDEWTDLEQDTFADLRPVFLWTGQDEEHVPTAVYGEAFYA